MENQIAQKMNDLNLDSDDKEHNTLITSSELANAIELLKPTTKPGPVRPDTIPSPFIQNLPSSLKNKCLNIFNKEMFYAAVFHPHTIFLKKGATDYGTRNVQLR